MPREARINQKDYTHYVVVSKRGKPLIESGWERAEDAREAIRLHYPVNIKTKVFTKTDLKHAGIDPDDDYYWLHMGVSVWDPEKGFDGLGEGGLHDLSKARAETLLRKLVAQDTKGFFRDNNWAPVHAIFKRLDEAGFEVRNLQAEYYRNRGSDLLNDGKSWTFQVPWTKGGWYVKILASWAGSATNPSNRYDILTQVSYSARLQF